MSFRGIQNYKVFLRFAFTFDNHFLKLEEEGISAIFHAKTFLWSTLLKYLKKHCKMITGIKLKKCAIIVSKFVVFIMTNKYNRTITVLQFLFYFIIA